MNNVFEALKTKAGVGRVEIADCNRGDLPEFFRMMGFKAGAEVGVYKGDFSRQLATFGGRLYSVDPWLCYEDYDEKSGKFQDKQNKLYEEAKAKLSEFPNVTIVRKTSMDAVKDFADESLDFVYIDAHHGFKYVTEDIWEWSKKIRPGGIISGHDYGILKYKKSPADPYTLHTKYVVDAYTAACGIKDWWVLGRPRRAEGEKGDNWRSWMWIKE